MKMNYKTVISILFLCAFLFRLPLTLSAWHGDLNNNISWGEELLKRGSVGFYGSEKAEDWPYSAPNQPPLTILMFGAMMKVNSLIDTSARYLNDHVGVFPSGFIWFWETNGQLFLAKLPGVIADLGIGFLIFSYFKHRKKIKQGIVLSAVWLFNPIVWYNSSVWGQTDSIVNFFGLLAIFYLLRKNLPKFSIFLTISLLFKGSLGIFIPVLATYAFFQNYSFKVWTKSVLLSLLTICLASVWFHPQIDMFFWLSNLYKERILPGEIGYLTANAFNFWWIVDSGKTPDSITYLGLSARMWGFIISLIGIGRIMMWLRKNKPETRIWFALALSALITFLFMTRIHERYLYPFFPVSTILIGIAPYLTLDYIILSAIHLLNLYHLFWVPPIPWLENLFQNSNFANVLALANLGVFFVTLRLFVKEKI